MKTLADIKKIIDEADDLERMKSFIANIDMGDSTETLLLMWMSQMLLYFYKSIVSHVKLHDISIDEIPPLTLMKLSVNIARHMSMEAENSMCKVDIIKDCLNHVIN